MTDLNLIELFNVVLSELISDGSDYENSYRGWTSPSATYSSGGSRLNYSDLRPEFLSPRPIGRTFETLPRQVISRSQKFKNIFLRKSRKVYCDDNCINVFIYIGQFKMCRQFSRNDQAMYALMAEIQGKVSSANAWYMTFNGKPISDPTMSFYEYNFQNGSCVNVNTVMCGGFNPKLDRKQKINRDKVKKAQKLENLLNKEYTLKSGDREKLKISIAKSTQGNFVKRVTQAINSGMELCGASLDMSFGETLIEDILWLSLSLIASETKTQRLLNIIGFIKMRSDKSIFDMTRGLFSHSTQSLLDNISEIYEDIFECSREDSFTDCLSGMFEAHGTFDNVDSIRAVVGLQNGVESKFSQLRGILDQYVIVKNLPFFKKFYKLIMYFIAHSTLGIKPKDLGYSKIQEEALKKEYYLGPDFVHCVLDTTLFMTERGYQCYKTGSMDPIYHSGKTYEDWYSKSKEIIRQSKFLSNPEAQGINIFKFNCELFDLIDKGESIYRYATALGKEEKKFIGGILDELKTVKAHELSKKAAQKMRQTPFSVLLCGESSIGKSTLTKVLFYHFAATFDMPREFNYMYTRTSTDDYWSGLTSDKHTILLDDIGQKNPNLKDDPSVTDIISVINQAPFVPPQAELGDKGRIPVKPEHVIATANMMDFNASSYFSYPIAVQRRLPYIIVPTPKDMYLKDNFMLDGSLVPEIQEGEYPDYWTFKVYRVKPVRPSGKTVAYHDLVLNFDNIHDLLAWYSRVALQHRETQSKVDECDKRMAQVSICKKCFYTQERCVCRVDDVQNLKMAKKFCFSNILGLVLSVFFGNWFTQTFMLLFLLIVELVPLLHFTVVCKLGTYARKYLQAVRFAKLIGERVEQKIGIRPIHIVGLSAFCVTTFSLYLGTKVAFKLSSLIFGTNSVVETQVKVMKPDVSDSMKEDEIFDRVGKKLVVRDQFERENVWYKDDYELSTFDVPVSCQGAKSMSKDDFHNMLLKNVFHLELDLGEEWGRVNLLALGDHYYLTNNHAIEKVNIMCKVVEQAGKDGVNKNFSFLLTEDMVDRFPERDLAILHIVNAPPRRKIIQFFTLDSMYGNFDGMLLKRSMEGYVTKQKCEGIQRDDSVLFDAPRVKGVIPLWKAFTDETVVGDCGAPLVAHTFYGPVILGIHVTWLGNQSGAIHVTHEFLSQYFASKDLPLVESGEPDYECGEYSKELTNLHPKSCVRYVQNGTSSVYGSLTGFRGKMKSRVKKTLICESMVRRGYEIKTGAPHMSGWEPWRNAIVDMVQPKDLNVAAWKVKKVYSTILEEWKREIPQDEKNKIQVLDFGAAINGEMGVTYIDKINRNSSAGFPWNKSKKYFMEAIKDERWQHGVTVNRNVKRRVATILTKVMRGERACPIFTGSLKDEPIKFAKITAKLTRVFAGSPLDFTIVMRMFYLSFVRLVQNNRYVFESGPGTIAQSREWKQLYNYLIFFGKHKIIAGDFKKFDKKMSTMFHWYHWWCVIQFHKHCGYTAEEITALTSISRDIIYAIYNFNGDFIEFWGTNPSGNSGTVLINSGTNQGYLRYAYAELKCENTGSWDCDDFRQKVHLMTYGDDNIMGVSDDVPWFNHTNIVRILADIGIVYTMADKEAESVPYISIDDAEFLKRKFVVDGETGEVFCPLNHESIEKMLTMCVASRTVSDKEQAIDVIGTALREYFFYGREVYDQKKQMFYEVVKENKLENFVKESTFCHWETLLNKFIQYPIKQECGYRC